MFFTVLCTHIENLKPFAQLSQRQNSLEILKTKKTIGADKAVTNE